ncbi:hypothetical protein JQ615_19285 [Bradyrhizobium jicamae]|uniref:Uncharacterized protein n=1 Tax=Bradyrhizobium jicamae TaxID=280332 RepID=A0ABS5FMF2_9BRAD|nr:hypothetical protein [Bradyrhizobium jicamae]MBR0797536.1 hypothetical protein [Bradyrhizobium jicamae]
MRFLIFGAILLISAAGLVRSQISSPATFSERFAPVLDQMNKPAGPIMAAG